VLTSAAVCPSGGLCVRTATVSHRGTGTLSSLQFIDTQPPPPAGVSSCVPGRGPSLLIGSSSGHVFTLSCTPHSTSPAESVYIEYDTLRGYFKSG